MNGLICGLIGAAAVSLVIIAALSIGEALERNPGALLPGEDIRLPGDETEEERRARQWVMLLGYTGEKGGNR